MRMSAKAEYAVRAMVELATADDGVLVKTDELATGAGHPAAVPRRHPVRPAHRPPGPQPPRPRRRLRARPARRPRSASPTCCARIDGPLASVHDIGLGDLPYSGATAALTDVWRALRASMRSVLEETSLADVAAGRLPNHVGKLADDYLDQEQRRGPATPSTSWPA